MNQTMKPLMYENKVEDEIFIAEPQPLPQSGGFNQTAANLLMNLQMLPTSMRILTPSAPVILSSAPVTLSSAPVTMSSAPVTLSSATTNLCEETFVKEIKKWECFREKGPSVYYKKA